jgi:shikimate kinase
LERGGAAAKNALDITDDGFIFGTASLPQLLEVGQPFQKRGVKKAFRRGLYMKKIIALAGPKHAGKTTAGRVLAALAKGVFFDLDDEVQKNTGKTARELYKEGQNVFQIAEREALQRVFGQSGKADCKTGSDGGVIIIALGGGFIDNEPALKLLTECEYCDIVFLAVPAKTAWRRIEAASMRSGELPAFLQTADPLMTHRIIHERRAAEYRKIAALTVEAEHKTVEEIAVEIMAAGELWKKNTP